MRNMDRLGDWWARIRKGAGHSKVTITVALLLHLVAYNYTKLGLTEYGFWILNDIALCFYFITLRLSSKGYVSMIATICLVYAVGSLGEDVFGLGAEYNVNEWFLAIAVAVYIIREYLHK